MVHDVFGHIWDISWLCRNLCTPLIIIFCRKKVHEFLTHASWDFCDFSVRVGNFHLRIWDQVSLGVILHVDLRPGIGLREMLLGEGEPELDFLFCCTKLCVLVKSLAAILDSYVPFDGLHAGGLTFGDMFREHVEINKNILKFSDFFAKIAFFQNTLLCSEATTTAVH